MSLFLDAMKIREEELKKELKGCRPVEHQSLFFTNVGRWLEIAVLVEELEKIEKGE